MKLNIESAALPDGLTAALAARSADGDHLAVLLQTLQAAHGPETARTLLNAAYQEMLGLARRLVETPPVPCAETGLIPCLRCGVPEADPVPDFPGLWRLRCVACGEMAPYAETLEGARAEWNRGGVAPSTMQLPASIDEPTLYAAGWRDCLAAVRKLNLEGALRATMQLPAAKTAETPDAAGWNACLDRVLHLNRPALPALTLERLTDESVPEFLTSDQQCLSISFQAWLVGATRAELIAHAVLAWRRVQSMSEREQKAGVSFPVKLVMDWLQENRIHDYVAIQRALQPLAALPVAA